MRQNRTCVGQKNERVQEEKEGKSEWKELRCMCGHSQANNPFHDKINAFIFFK